MSNLDHLDLLTDDDIREALAEVRQLRTDVDALRLKRDAVFAAMNEVDELQANVNTSAQTIKEHLKQAL